MHPALSRSNANITIATPLVAAPELGELADHKVVHVLVLDASQAGVGIPLPARIRSIAVVGLASMKQKKRGGRRGECVCERETDGSEWCAC